MSYLASMIWYSTSTRFIKIVPVTIRVTRNRYRKERWIIQDECRIPSLAIASGLSKFRLKIICRGEFGVLPDLADSPQVMDPKKVATIYGGSKKTVHLVVRTRKMEGIQQACSSMQHTIVNAHFRYWMKLQWTPSHQNREHQGYYNKISKDSPGSNGWSEGNWTGKNQHIKNNYHRTE